MSWTLRALPVLACLVLGAACAADLGDAVEPLVEPRAIINPDSMHPAVDVVLVLASADDVRAAQRVGLAVDRTPEGLARVTPPRTIQTLDGRGTDIAMESLDPGQMYGISGIPVMLDASANGAVAVPRDRTLELLSVEANPTPYPHPVPMLEVTPEAEGWQLAALASDPDGLTGQTLRGVAPATFSIDGTQVNGVAVLLVGDEPVGVVGRPALDDGGSVGIMPYAQLVLGAF